LERACQALTQPGGVGGLLAQPPRSKLMERILKKNKSAGVKPFQARARARTLACGLR
jgi:hypothetical protein